MKRISIDGGKTFVTVEEALSRVEFDEVIRKCNMDTMNRASQEVGPASIFDCLRRYLEIADEDLILG